MTGDCHVRFGERLEGKFLRSTHPDFSTRASNPNFNLDPYLEKAMKIMKPYGYSLTVDEKDLKDKSVQSRFIKDDSIKKIIFKHKQDERQKIKIKIEIDTEPSRGAI
jgi:hypothetical protein